MKTVKSHVNWSILELCRKLLFNLWQLKDYDPEECLDCKRVATLVLLHVRGCSDERCVVPGCRARKEQLLVDQWRSALEG